MESEDAEALCMHRGMCGKVAGQHDVHVRYAYGVILETWWDDPVEGPLRLRKHQVALENSRRQPQTQTQSLNESSRSHLMHDVVHEPRAVRAGAG
ncbi:hypothetical protein GCM10009789_42290 [Kribbella sancticallisti]|uniref:Uncharacterized protein n=1 Tax=Kribbella sancticallisti TaxID=460087 RepID=A0ABN2DTC5_9ACTN